MQKHHRYGLFGTIVIMAMIFSMLLSSASSAAIADEFEVPPASYSSEISDKINGIIENNKEKTPSISVIYFSDKENISTVRYGKADIENNIAADENTVYEWGSVSKLLIWTSAMQLYEQGKLDLDKDIRSYLPDGFLKKLTYSDPITMKHLMNHSAGFLTPSEEIETDDLNELMPLDEALRKTEPVQAYRPGETVAYSNYGAALAGYVIQCVSGTDYAEYVKKNIFERLGMEHTAIKPDLSDNQWVDEQRKKTRCYASGENGLVSLGECRRYIHLYPAGSACGTIDDLAVFARALLHESKGCPLFDKDDTMITMLEPSMYYSDGSTARFRHGLMCETEGIYFTGHGGNTEGFTSALQLDIFNRTGFVMMTNKQQDRIYENALKEELYGPINMELVESAINTKYEFSGNYIITGGTFATGSYSIYNVILDNFNVSSTGHGYKGSNGVADIRQISDNTAIFKLITGKEDVYYIRKDSSGNFTGFSNSSFDFIKISDSEYFFGWAVIYAMLAALLFMVIMTFIHLIRLRKFKGKPLFGYKITELLMSVSSIGITAGTVLLFTSDPFDTSKRTVFCIMIAVFTALLIITNIAAIFKKLKSGFSVMLLIETLCTALITTGVIYWKLFQFWGM